MLRATGRFFFWLADWRENQKIRKQSTRVATRAVALTTHREKVIDGVVERDIQMPPMILMGPSAFNEKGLPIRGKVL